MMEVGNLPYVNEDRAHFSMWCMLAAPLIAGNDLRNMTKETIEILTNKEAISINQDPLGIQGFKFSVNDGIEIWFKPLVNEEWAVCFLNRSKETKKVEFDWSLHSIIDEFANRELDLITTTYKIRDIWAKKEIGTTESKFFDEIPSHDVKMMRLIPVK